MCFRCVWRGARGCRCRRASARRCWSAWCSRRRRAPPWRGRAAPRARGSRWWEFARGGARWRTWGAPRSSRSSPWAGRGRRWCAAGCIASSRVRGRASAPPTPCAPGRWRASDSGWPRPAAASAAAPGSPGSWSSSGSLSPRPRRRRPETCAPAPPAPRRQTRRPRSAARRSRCCSTRSPGSSSGKTQKYALLIKIGEIWTLELEQKYNWRKLII